MMIDDFDAQFDLFRDLAFRLEALPAYDVGAADAQRWAAFTAGQPLPERSVRTSSWLARIAGSTIVDNKSWERVRVVDDPLTDYQRYELRAYRESQAVGEQVRILPRIQADDCGSDFWLFDPGTDRAWAVVMNYTPQGRWLGWDMLTDPDRVRAFAEIRKAALADAIPLNEFLVGAGG